MSNHGHRAYEAQAAPASALPDLARAGDRISVVVRDLDRFRTGYLLIDSQVLSRVSYEAWTRAINGPGRERCRRAGRGPVR